MNQETLGAPIAEDRRLGVTYHVVENDIYQSQSFGGIRWFCTKKAWTSALRARPEIKLISTSDEP